MKVEKLWCNAAEPNMVKVPSIFRTRQRNTFDGVIYLALEGMTAASSGGSDFMRARTACLVELQHKTSHHEDKVSQVQEKVIKKK